MIHMIDQKYRLDRAESIADTIFAGIGLVLCLVGIWALLMLGSL